MLYAGAPLLAFGFDQRNLPRGDFAQGRDYFLVVRLDQRPCTLQQLLGTARRSEYQFEPIRNVFEAIFYSYSGHRTLIFRPSAPIVNEPAGTCRRLQMPKALFREASVPEPSPKLGPYFSAGSPQRLHSAHEPSKSLMS